MGSWQGKGLCSFHPKGQKCLGRRQCDLLKEEDMICFPSWLLLPLIQLLGSPPQDPAQQPPLIFFPFLEKEARERAVPAHGSRWLELGQQQPLTKCLSALIVSSSGNGGCDVSAASPREKYTVQNGQLAKHRRMVRVTPSSPYHPALNWQENHNVVDLKATVSAGRNIPVTRFIH